MLDKDPLSYSHLTYAWVLIIASWGGVANYLHKVKNGNVHAFSVVELVGELVISGFSGLMTFYMCESFNAIPGPMTPVLVGMGGHMGSRTIFLIEQYIKSRLDGDKKDPP
jgi:hypothetical protein